MDEATAKRSTKRRVWLLAVLLSAAALVGCSTLSHRGKIQPPYSYDEVKGLDYQMVKEAFREAGFTWIYYDYVDDGGSLAVRGEGDSVAYVIVDGDDEFLSTSWYPEDAQIEIRYYPDPAKRKAERTLPADEGTARSMAKSEAAADFVVVGERVVFENEKPAWLEVDLRNNMSEATDRALCVMLVVNDTVAFRTDSEKPWQEYSAMLDSLVEPGRTVTVRRAYDERWGELESFYARSVADFDIDEFGQVSFEDAYTVFSPYDDEGLRRVVREAYESGR